MDDFLVLSGVGLQFGGLTALSDVSFSMQPGEVVAIIGPNGAGKTSLFNTITGFSSPTTGEIKFRGERIDGLSPHSIAAKGLRRTFQNGGIFDDLSVLENVLTGLHTQSSMPVLQIIFGVRRAKTVERKMVQRAWALLESMNIAHMADHSAGSLSGGQRRMVEILRAIATNPPLLLLDEPAVGLAPPVRSQLMDTIRQLAQQRGIGILIVEHAIELVMNVSDRIVVMNQGQKIADDTPAEIRQNSEVLEAYLGHA